MKTMKNKQTAIEFIEDELSKLNSEIITAKITQEEYHKQRVSLWAKAKEMEKEQIIDARVSGFSASAEGWNGEIPCMKWSEIVREIKCEEYYIETYRHANDKRN